MKTSFYFLLITVFIALGCKKTVEEKIPVPNNVSNITAEPRVGGILLKWDIPDSSSYMYLEVTYDKNGKKITQNVPEGVDSVLIKGLLNKYDYIFEIQPFTRGLNSLVAGTSKKTETPVKPIRRSVTTVYYPNDLTKVKVTADMLETFTQEQSEGPKENLVDDDRETFWHSAWSSGVQPLPHWIKVTFPEAVEIGVIKYFLRQTSNTNGSPSQFGFETSEDGENWERVWISEAGLSTSDVAAEKALILDENYKSKYFRLLILQTAGNTTFTHLGEISFYSMASKVTDLEEDAEKQY